ncbi:methyltransferase type 11 [Bacillus pseudomycoides]|nr:methyltransferase type 11 [Bacillus pseudomycoides]PHE69931.1 methyltransferase type 11 [Bacillus pseudomycoides]
MEFSNGINAPKENYGKGRKMISVMDILADEPIIYENIRNSVQVDDKTESKNKVENGDLVFVRSSEIRDEVGWAKAYRQKEYALYSGFSIRGKKKSDFDAKFIELSLNNSNREQIERQAGGSTRFNVSQSILKSIGILEPSIEEQIEIGNLFKKLDETIALHQQELTILKQTKQGFLQKMFPKEGESVPEVRFPGFTEEWEQIRLGDRATIKGRLGWKSLKQEEYTSDGPSMIAGKHINNGVIDWNVVDHIPQWRYDESPEIMLKNGDVIFSKDGSLGNPALISGLNVLATINSTMMLVRIDETIDPSFFYQVMKSEKFERLIYLKVSGSSIPHLFQADMNEFMFLAPVKEEQIKIGNFFKQLDDTSALHQRELDALKETKKAFLQKMFA